MEYLLGYLASCLDFGGCDLIRLELGSGFIAQARLHVNVWFHFTFFLSAQST